MLNYIEIQEREVNRYLQEIRDKTTRDAHDQRIKDSLLFFGIDNFSFSCSILVVGCRDGRQMNILKQKGFKNIYGIDIVSSMVEKCNARGFDVIQCDVHALSIGIKIRKFDLIIATHVLEHCYSPLLAVQEMKHALNLQGKLFLEVPINRKDKKGDWGHYVNFDNCEDVFDYCDGFQLVKKSESKNTARLVLKKYE